MATEPDARVETLRPVEESVPRVEVASAVPEESSWWDRYCFAVRFFPDATRRVVAVDAAYIADRAVPMVAGMLDEQAFGDHRVRTGIVVGSVQSGKTASMLAVAALLLDRKIDLLVVLAGTRVALWLQTYERLLTQLDGSDLTTAWKRNSLRTLVPQPEDVLLSTERVDPAGYLRGSRTRVKAALASGKPVIFVVPKEDDHLLALGRFLTEQLSDKVLECRKSAVSMVVLDDEADDASVLDAVDSGKITPQFIQQLWAPRGKGAATRHSRLFATYIAYTATPQANYLQQNHNPLAPRDFHASLRVPSDRGIETPRATTYIEPTGLKAYYTGGDFYYERFRGLKGDPCVAYPFPEAVADADAPNGGASRYESIRWQMIGDSLRAYLVSGAVRLLLSGKRMPRSDIGMSTKSEVEEATPDIHSMLYHPSALKDDQFAGAADIVRWSSHEAAGVLPSITDRMPRDDAEGVFKLDALGLNRRLEAEENLWSAWLDKFRDSSTALAAMPGASHSAIHSMEWASVKAVLVSDIFPFVQLKVLNSDPRAGDRPDFTVRDDDNGRWHKPSDLLTIFVAGNVLSRGLTIEGLNVSLFLRSAKEPAADTQMQMQRWFGYRGKHFEFCRVFAFGDQLGFFRKYHSNDQAMKTEIINHMGVGDTPFGSGVLVLQGEGFKATSKVETRRVPLHPGPTPSIRLVDPSSSATYDANIALVADLLGSGDWQYLEFPEGTRRGLIKTTSVDMLEAATILERLRYAKHDPSLDLDLSQRWVSLQRHLDLADPLFRPPGRAPGPMAVDPSNCPYSVAAYLRLWAAALQRPNTPGLQPTDSPGMPWNLINTKMYRESAPRFYIGVRFGADVGTEVLSFLGQPIQTMRRGFAEGRDDLLATLWGSRNPSERWFGDQVFDYHYHNASGAPRLLQDGAWRPRGHPGLLLFHPIAEPRTMRELIAVGLALPHGGPDHVAALRGAD